MGKVKDGNKFYFKIVLWYTKDLEKQAVLALKKNLESILKLLKTLSANITLNHDTREGTNILICQINLKFICLINFWNDVVTQIDHVNILLQSKNQTINIACNLINGLIRLVKEIRKPKYLV